jgi:hypothetical protein
MGICPGCPVGTRRCFYRGLDEFEKMACDFAEAGARAGVPVMIACAEQGLGRLRARLDGLGECVTWADMADIGANPNRLISAISRFAGQYPGRCA